MPAADTAVEPSDRLVPTAASAAASTPMPSIIATVISTR
jgi:hypothetical protein